MKMNPDPPDCAQPSEALPNDPAERLTVCMQQLHRLVSDRIMGILQSELQGEDVSFTQMTALYKVRAFAPISSTLLSEHLGVSLPATSQLIQELVSRELMERRANPENRRERLPASATRATVLIVRERAMMGAYTQCSARSVPRRSTALNRPSPPSFSKPGSFRRGPPPSPTAPNPTRISPEPTRRPYDPSRTTANSTRLEDRINYAEVLPQGTKVLILVGTLLGLFLAALDQTIVSTSLPRIIGDLNGLNLYSWVTTAYLLASTAMVPIYGKLSDIYGRKAVLLFGIVVFLIGSALCGIAGEPWFGNLFGGGMMQLIIFRGLQGFRGRCPDLGGLFHYRRHLRARRTRRVAGLFGAVFGISAASSGLCWAAS